MTLLEFAVKTSTLSPLSGKDGAHVLSTKQRKPIVDHMAKALSSVLAKLPDGGEGFLKKQKS